MDRILNQSVSASVRPPLSRTNNNQYHKTSYDVHKSNFIWFEDDGDTAGIGPLRTIGHKLYLHYVQLWPFLPFGMMLIILTIILILIVSQRWQGVVAGIVAGCLTLISIYSLLSTLKEQRLVYE